MRVLNQTLGLLRNYAQRAVCVKSLVALSDNECTSRTATTLLTRVKSVFMRVAIPSICLALALSGVYAQCKGDADGNGIIDDSDLLQVLFCFGQNVDRTDMTPCQQGFANMVNDLPVAKKLGINVQPDDVSRVGGSIIAKTVGGAIFAVLPEAGPLRVFTRDGRVMELRPGIYHFRLIDPKIPRFEITNLQTGDKTSVELEQDTDPAARRNCECSGKTGTSSTHNFSGGTNGGITYTYCSKCDCATKECIGWGFSVTLQFDFWI